MGTKHVLIVDDAIDLGRLLSEALKTANPGLPVTVVPSAEEAILESTRLTIDLLVTDIRLPGMTGLDLVRKIRLRQPDIKVLVITGLAMDNRLQKQLDEINPDAFMHKPMSMPEFLDTTSALLGLDLLENLPLAEVKKPSTGKLTPPPQETVEDQMLRDVLAQALPGVAAEDLTLRRASTGKTAELKPQSEPEDGGLSVQLSGLRSSLGAKAVLLLDDRGHTMAQAGDLPGSGLMEQWAPSIMASLSAGARLSYLLGESSIHSVQAYRGKEYDLVYAPVGQYALLVVLIPGKSSLRLALAFEEALNAEKSLMNVLEEMGLHIQSTTEIGVPEKVITAEMMPAAEMPAADEKDALLEQLFEGAAVHEAGLDKFEELLSSQTSKLDQDADAFWETAGGKEELDLNTPGVLSYEQAQKLGLLPDQREG